MEESRKRDNTRKVNDIIQSLKNQNKYDENTLSLVRGDLEYGVEFERIEKYLKGGYNFEQRKFYSSCLRKDTPDDVLEVIADRAKTADQMVVAYEFYKKGIPLEQIQAVFDENHTPIMMRKSFEQIMEQARIVEESIPEDKEYAQDIVNQIKEVIVQIFGNGEKYDKLLKAITELADKNENQANDELVKKNEELEKLLNDQQTKLNEASAANKKLQNNIKSLEKELEDMQKEKDKMETKEEVNAQENQSVENVANSNAVSISGGYNAPAQTKQITPVYYTIPIVDEHGRVVHYAPVERSARVNKSGITALFSKLNFKKKSKQDMIKILSSGELDKSQLIQVKNAVIKGLTEEQITNLIVNKIDADKMEEIIEIAVLENREAQ